MKKLILSLVAIAAFQTPVWAKIEMGAPFSDNLVLQRERAIPVWGTATPNNEVTVEFGGASAKAVADAKGNWRVKLPAFAASKENRTMTITESEVGLFGSSVDCVKISNVVVGEVWFASGQSNMQCQMWGVNTRYRERAGGIVTEMANMPYVRYVKVPNRSSVTPAKVVAAWRTFTSEYKNVNPERTSMRQFSAVAFYYARELYLALDIPIGILDASWGGTNIDAWTPRCGYDDCDPSIRDTANYKVKANWKMETDKVGPINGTVQQPTVLFNGMVDAFAPMAMRGFIWYQGCHNSSEANLYCAKMHALYNGWSRRFENPDLKLYFVQLAPYTQNWMGISAAQNKFVSEQKNAAIAVTADVGNFYDIHPNQKEIVAQRLAIHALKRDYGFDIPEDNSPVLKKAEFTGDKVVMDFSHVSEWFVYADNNSHKVAFEVAGEDGVWQSAKVMNFKRGKDSKGVDVEKPFIPGTKIEVKSDAVAAPVKVRYMGKPMTSGTMFNQVGLPLGQFEAAK